MPAVVVAICGDHQERQLIDMRMSLKTDGTRKLKENASETKIHSETMLPPDFFVTFK